MTVGHMQSVKLERDWLALSLVYEHLYFTKHGSTTYMNKIKPV